MANQVAIVWLAILCSVVSPNLYALRIYAKSLSHQGGDSRTLKPVTDIAEFDSKLAEIARDFETDTRECTSHTGLGGERNDRS